MHDLCQKDYEIDFKRRKIDTQKSNSLHSLIGINYQTEEKKQEMAIRSGDIFISEISNMHIVHAGGQEFNWVLIVYKNNSFSLKQQHIW